MDQDAAPKAAWLNVSIMQHPFGTVIAYLRLVEPTGGVRLGQSRMESRLDCTQHGGGIIAPTQLEYHVAEDVNVVTMSIERQQADPETSASVEARGIGWPTAASYSVAVACRSFCLAAQVQIRSILSFQLVSACTGIRIVQPSRHFRRGENVEWLGITQTCKASPDPRLG